MRNNAVKQAMLFFALTLAISYCIVWGPLAVFQITAISFVDKSRGPGWAIALYVLGGFVPSLTAIGLTCLIEGGTGLRSIGKRLVHFRIGARWYRAALGLIAFGALAQILINYALGHSFDWSLFIRQSPSLLPLLILGPLSEEIGWRGYAQDRLQTKFPPLISGIIVGVFWGLWHLPLFFIPGTSQNELDFPFPGFLLGVISLSVLFAWLHNHTNGSIWTAIFFHWIFTFAAQVVGTGVTRSSLYDRVEYIPYFIAAIAIALLWTQESKTKSDRTFQPVRETQQ